MSADPSSLPPSEDGDAVERFLADAHRGHPELPPDTEGFLSHALGRLSPGPGPSPRGALLAELHAADLFLAFWCTRGHAGAMAALERRLPRPSAWLARRWGAPLHELDSVRQQVLTRALVGEGRSPPALLGYSGRGSLEGWLHVLGRRVASLHRTQPVSPVSEIPSEAPALLGETDTETELLKAEGGELFRRAFRHALQALEKPDRTLLRLHVQGGLGLDALSRVYRVHRATIARRLQSTRAVLLESTRRHLSEELRLSTEEVAELLQALRSRLDTSLSGLARS